MPFFFTAVYIVQAVCCMHGGEAGSGDLAFDVSVLLKGTCSQAVGFAIMSILLP